MERTIKVTGKGRLKVRPDTIRIIITLNAALSALGFESSDIRTLSFSINPVQEGYQTEDGAWRSRLLGFEYIHSMKIEFPIDADRLGQVMYVLAHITGTPDFRIEYTLADPESAKSELLERAVADSRRKAQILAEAAGVALGELVNIDYSWGEVEFVTRPLRLETKMMADGSNQAAGSYDINIASDDIDVSETVTLIWNIC